MRKDQHISLRQRSDATLKVQRAIGDFIPTPALMRCLREKDVELGVAAGTQKGAIEALTMEQTVRITSLLIVKRTSVSFSEESTWHLHDKNIF